MRLTAAQSHYEIVGGGGGYCPIEDLDIEIS
jgi:hypothetical protein